MIKFIVAVFAMVCSFSLVAAEAAAEATGSSGILGTGYEWKDVGPFLLGMLIMALVKWGASWLDGKGAKFIQDRLIKIQESANKNDVLAQLAADDALFKIVEAAVPEVMGEISATMRKDLADGKFNAVDWKDIGSRLWERVKPHVEGGKNDYLKNSSFADGKVMAEYIAKKIFAKKAAEKNG